MCAMLQQIAVASAAVASVLMLPPDPLSPVATATTAIA